VKRDTSHDRSRKNRLQLIAMAAIPLLLLVASIVLNPGSGFQGSDDIGTSAIAEIQPGVRPWFSLPWSPPKEVEKLLFALQAALGAGAIGYYFGRKSR